MHGARRRRLENSQRQKRRTMSSGGGGGGGRRKTRGVCSAARACASVSDQSEPPGVSPSDGIPHPPGRPIANEPGRPLNLIIRSLYSYGPARSYITVIAVVVVLVVVIVVVIVVVLVRLGYSYYLQPSAVRDN